MNREEGAERKFDRRQEAVEAKAARLRAIYAFFKEAFEAGTTPTLTAEAVRKRFRIAPRTFLNDCRALSATFCEFGEWRRTIKLRIRAANREEFAANLGEGSERKFDRRQAAVEAKAARLRAIYAFFKETFEAGTTPTLTAVAVRERFGIARRTFLNNCWELGAKHYEFDKWRRTINRRIHERLFDEGDCRRKTKEWARRRRKKRDAIAERVYRLFQEASEEERDAFTSVDAVANYFCVHPHTMRNIFVDLDEREGFEEWTRELRRPKERTNKRKSWSEIKKDRSNSNKVHYCLLLQENIQARREALEREHDRMDREWNEKVRLYCDARSRSLKSPPPCEFKDWIRDNKDIRTDAIAALYEKTPKEEEIFDLSVVRERLNAERARIEEFLRAGAKAKVC